MSDCDTQPNPSFASPGGGQAYVTPPLDIGTINYSTGDCATNDANYIANLQAEAISAAAGPVNVFLMLGVHSQGSTQDTVSTTGYPLSSGTPSGFNLLDAFNVNTESWRSVQLGQAVLTAPAYIGYSFGTKKAWEAVGPAQERYFPSEPVRRQISTLVIKQGADPLNRATQVRVDASDDGLTWHRIDVLNVPNTSSAVSLNVRSSAAYNQWRLVPVFFNGVASNMQWEVEQVQFLEASTVAIDNIQDFFLLENRDRAYTRTSVMIKCQYDLLDVQTELAKFGINLPQTYIFTTSFATLIRTLGRPLVVGDVLELPGEVQYDTSLRPVRKWLEVTDTSWSTEGYTPNWKPQLYKFYAQPIMPSQEHRDLLGVPGQVNATQSDSDLLELGSLLNNQAYEANDAIIQEMKNLVPQDGGDAANIQSGKALIGPRGSFDGRDLYVSDAIAPSGAEFTSGDSLPAPADITTGHYHRQTYTMLSPTMRPADRLLRWNGTTWHVVEVNTKVTSESHRKTASRLLQATNRIDLGQKV